MTVASVGRRRSPQGHRGPVDPRLLRELPALRTAVVGFAGVSVVETAAVIAQAILLARIVAEVFIGRRSLGEISGALIGLTAVMAIRAVAEGGGEWVGHRASGRARSQLRHLLLDGVVRLGPEWLSAADRGPVTAAAGPGIESLDGYVTRAVPAVVAATLTPLLVLAAIGIADWPSLLLLALVLPLVPVFSILIGVTTRRHMDRQWATLSKLSGQFLDLLQGLTTLKVYGRSKAQVQAIADGTDRYRRHTMATLRVAFLSGLVLDLLATLSVAVVAVTVGLRLDHGRLTLERALTVLLLAPEVFAPLRAAGAQHHATEEARAVTGTVIDILDQVRPHPPADPTPPGAPPDPAVAADPTAPVGPGAPGGSGSEVGTWVLRPDVYGALARLRNATVTYPGRACPALDRVDVDIRPGQLTVVMGQSGAGKTTLLGVLRGRLPLAGGSLTVGADRRRPEGGRHAERWRANQAWVPQRPRPTQETVAAEVRLGDPAATDAQVEGVLRACAAPAGAALVGEDGGVLSAGMRRRVALARALARARRVAADGGVPLVLLDEPTEDLDAATRAVVIEVVTELATWAAVVVATHDPSLHALAVRRLHVDGGRITTTIAHPGSPERRVVGAGPGPVDPAPSSSLTPAAASTRAGSPAGSTGVRWGVRDALRADRSARRALLLAGALAAAGGVSGLALTTTSVWLICRAAQHPDVQALAIAVVGVRTFALSRALFRYGERLAAHDGALRLLAGVRAHVFAALEPLAPAALGQFRRGDLLRRFTTDVDCAQEALIRAVIPLVGATTTAVAAVILAALVDPAAALLLAAGILVGGVLIPVATRRAACGGEAALELCGRRDELSNGLLDGLDELDAYGAATDRILLIDDVDRRARHAAAPAGLASALGVTAVGVTAAVTVAAVVAEGTRAVTAGSASPLLVGVLAVAVLVAFDAISALPAGFAALGRCSAGLARVEQVLAVPAPFPAPPRPAHAPVSVTAVTATGLTLRPALDAAPLLVDVDLEAAVGRRVAIVGPSGAGKTSLLAALLRLLPAWRGRIDLCDGPRRVGLADLHPDEVPTLIAGSLQGDHLFATSLRDNLRVVAPAAGDGDLDVVAGRVGLADWIRSLPDGWSTQSGADGAHVSGGQRQRLLLARALLANPRVLVLDEPTAHLDAATETAIMADLMSATAGRSLVVSTHRSALLDDFDSVVRIEGRRLVPDPNASPLLLA